jgi:hypothetical protein
MCQSSDEKETPVQSDHFTLDFGKKIFGVEEKAGPLGLGRKKMIPEPGKTEPATSVPLSEVLNPDSQKKD